MIKIVLAVSSWDRKRKGGKVSNRGGRERGKHLMDQV